MDPRCLALVLFPHPTVGEAVTPLTSISPPQDCPLPDRTDPPGTEQEPPRKGAHGRLGCQGFQDRGGQHQP